MRYFDNTPYLEQFDPAAVPTAQTGDGSPVFGYVLVGGLILIAAGIVLQQFLLVEQQKQSVLLQGRDESGQAE